MDIRFYVQRAEQLLTTANENYTRETSRGLREEAMAWIKLAELAAAVPASLPDGTITAYPNVSGAPVCIRHVPDHLSPESHRYDCQGCGEGHSVIGREAAQKGADRHSRECRALPMPPSAAADQHA